MNPFTNPIFHSVVPGNIWSQKHSEKKDKKSDNDMTQSKIWCINSGNNDKCEVQMERVTGEERYTCHYCGAVIEIHFKGH